MEDNSVAKQLIKSNFKALFFIRFYLTSLFDVGSQVSKLKTINKYHFKFLTFIYK